MSTENQKIPCGGFRIGDGLAMDGDTLKSLGGTFVKITINNDGSGKITDDSPLKYNDIKRIVFGSGSEEIDLKFPIFCVAHSHILTFSGWDSNGAIFDTFYMSDVMKHKIGYATVIIFGDDAVQSAGSFYILTPAT